jgi:bifunctional UDP-N-acetylglucosamine pyrophosphorylase/glucosamine-1-phosphate N-acetyltransferase
MLQLTLKIMKAIILAAWEWTRLKPITNTTPKPLIKIMWQSILEYNLECIYKKVDEIFVVVKYLKEKFITKFWDNYKWTKITYIEQWEEKWTWAALFNIPPQDNDLIVLSWDSIIEEEDIKRLIKSEHYSCLVKKVEDPSKYWIYRQDNDDFAIEVVEKPTEDVWNLASLWYYKFSGEILDLVKKIKKSSRWEYELTDAINMFIKTNKFELIKIKWEFIDISYPWDILDANSHFLDKLKRSKIEWKIERWVVIKWNLILEKWALLKSGTYIEWNVYIWENSQIWPNAYLRWNNVIWKNCKVGNAVEVKNSSIWNNTNVAHLSYIWNSVIWNNTNIGWWFISANLRHDWANIKAMVNWKLIDTWKRKLWVIIWDNVKTWVYTTTMPWRIIENDSFTMPQEVVK